VGEVDYSVSQRAREVKFTGRLYYDNGGMKNICFTKANVFHTPIIIISLSQCLHQLEGEYGTNVHCKHSENLTQRHQKHYFFHKYKALTKHGFFFAGLC